MIDLGASFHTIAHRDVLENYVVESHEKVYLANGEPLDIIRMGDISLKMFNESVWKIQRMIHVPGLTMNLILVG